MAKFSDQFNEEQLINEFKEVVSDAEALLKATANTGGEKLAEIRAKAEESISIVRESIFDAESSIMLKSKVLAKATDVYVHENPWRSIGLAASVGMVIGLLVGRR